MTPEQMSSLRDHLDTRFDKVEDKLDKHLERIATAETHISWLRGHAKLTTAVVLAVAGFLAAALYYLTTGQTPH